MSNTPLNGAGWLVLAGLLATPTLAWAGFGAVGPAVPPDQDAPIDPLLAWRAARPVRGTVSFGALLESLADPLVRTSVNQLNGEEVEVATLAQVVGPRFGGRVAVSDRVEVAASLPIWLLATGDEQSDAGGPALGDLQFSVPVQLMGATLGAAEVAVGVVPWATLPTGAAARHLGDTGPSVGAQAMVDVQVGPVLGLAWGGVDLRAFPAQDNVLPGPGAVGGASVGLQIDPRFAVHLGARADSRLRGVETELDGAPRRPWGSELVLSARGSLFEGWYATGGLGMGLHPGPGSARSRVWLGFGHTWPGKGPVAAVESPVEDPTETLDPPAFSRAVQVRVQDAEGVPLAASLAVVEADVQTRAGPDGTGVVDLGEGRWTVRASAPGFGAQERSIQVDPAGPTEELRFILLPELGDNEIRIRLRGADGDPVVGAEVDVDGRPVGQSSSGGELVVGGLGEAPVAVDVRADTFRELAAPSVQPSPDGAVADLLLQRERGAVQVVVRGPQGARVTDASVRFMGADRLGPFQVGEAGRRTFVLRPGPWQLLVSSPAFGLQQRVVEISERDTGLQVVEVVLQPPEQGTTDWTLRVLDADNQPVPDARVALDQVDYGTTSSGGEIVIEGLREGPRTVAISGDFLRPNEAPILLAGGLQEDTVVVDWKEGSTMILARSPTGLVADATARFDGPQPLPASPLGEDGVHVLTLAPGAWQVLVASPVWGFQQRGVSIAQDSATLHVVDAVLNPGEQGVGQLEVRVVDPEGRPVRGAEVALDGVSLGTTSTSGSLTLVELATGARQLQVQRAPYATASVPVQIDPDGTVADVALAWGVGAVRVGVAASGEPVDDATLRLGGPRFVPATPVDGSGRRLFTLEPGQWQLLASSPRFTPAQRLVDVPATAGLTEVEVTLEPMVAGLAEVLVRVQDPDGHPVPGASVQLDGQPALSAGDGGLAVLTEVEPGPHRFTVAAPHFEGAVFEDLTVASGVSERILPLAWRPTPVTVTVLGPDGPVVGADVRFDGPSDEPGSQTDAQGRIDTTLRPGRWTVLASAADLGTRAGDLALSPGDEARSLTLELSSAQVQVQGTAMVIKDTIYFDVGQATIKPESASILDEVAAVLRAHPELVRVDVEGHTDPTGGVAYNLRLSRRRAAAVVAGLVARGVAPERLVSHGYGPTRPVADNGTEDGRAANRRVEFRTEARR